MTATSPPVWADVPAPPPAPPAAEQPAILQPLLVIAALGSAAIHFGFAPMHLEANKVHGAFFLAVAWLQLGWALAVARKPSTLTYRLGILLNAGVIGVWLVSRTVGIDGVVEPWGVPDGAAAGLQAFVIVGSFGPLTRRLPRTEFRELTTGAVLGASAIAVSVLVSASMLPSLSGHGSDSGHSHGGSTETVETAGADDHHADGATDAAAHADGEGHDAADGSADAATHAQAVAVPYDPELPIDLGGIEGVTAKQQAEAENVVADTLLGLPQWSDPKVAEAAGFRSIGDGGTGTEHLINQAYMDDDTILDPNKPESLVYDTTDGKRELAAAMYMLKTGTPLAEVPTLGGDLMQWHTHQNLCYNDQGRVAGVTDAEGKCRPGLVKPPETPMIHVWIRKHPCGPFAALEGIGAGAIAEGEERLCDHAHGS